MPKIIENLSDILIAQARRQVMENGYSALNIRSIAKNCGVGVGTVYNYFPSKSALVAGFLLEDWNDALARMDDVAAQTGDPAATLERMYREVADFACRYGELFRSAAESEPVPTRKYHSMLRGQLSRILQPLLTDAFAADFAAEAVLAWAVEGVPFSQLWEALQKVIL